MQTHFPVPASLYKKVGLSDVVIYEWSKVFDRGRPSYVYYSCIEFLEKLERKLRFENVWNPAMVQLLTSVKQKKQIYIDTRGSPYMHNKVTHYYC